MKDALFPKSFGATFCRRESAYTFHSSGCKVRVDPEVSFDISVVEHIYSSLL